MFGLTTVHASLRLRAGEVHIAREPSNSTVQASIDAASFASGNAKRDRDVTSTDLLDSAVYPEITFTGQSTRPRGPGWAVQGSVAAHGATDPVEVYVDQAGFEDDIAHFHATARIDRTRFGITNKKGMVGRYVDLIIDAFAVPA